jgi:hypothetical protein
MKIKLLILVCFFPLTIFSQNFPADTSKFLPSDTIGIKDTLTLKTAGVKVKSNKSSVSGVYSTMKKTASVSDGISSESIKKTPDATASDALKRVSGVTIQNNKFVIVRGLPDRYNSALLDRLFVSSTEPDRRSFSFDIIPSNLIDNIMIYKSASANLPGDFAGGLIDVTTIEVKDKGFNNLTLGLGFGSMTAFQKFYRFGYSDLSSYFPNTYNYRSASLLQRKEWTKMIGCPSDYSFNSGTSFPNYNFNYNLGIKRKRFGIIGSISQRNSLSRSFSERADYESEGMEAYRYKDTLYSSTSLFSGILNSDFYFKKYTLQFKNIFSSQTENIYQRRGGKNFDNGLEIQTGAFNTTQKKFLNSQLGLKRDFSKDKKMNFDLTFGVVSRSQPDYRIDPHSRSIGSNEKFEVIWRETYRFWSQMKDYSYGSKLDFTLGKIKTGVSYYGKTREFSARVFRYQSEDLLDEITNNTDKYSASFNVISAYAMWEGEIKGAKLSAGLRDEANLFYVQTADFSGSPVLVAKSYNNLLPSFNLIVKKGKKINLRASGSKTVIRPEFREISNFSYYDFTRNAQIIGNPKLIQSDVYNGDLKIEYFPKSDEIFSLSLFGKKIQSPIEQTVSEGSTPSNFILTFTNSKRATIVGVEGEVRKKIKGLGYVYSNFSFVNSVVQTPIGNRPLQGQSPFSINAGANFEMKRMSLTITENIVGNRIANVGFLGYPDIYENTRGVLDASLQYKTKKMTCKFNAGNILPQSISLYQKSPKRDLVKTTTESVFSFSITYNFK